MLSTAISCAQHTHKCANLCSCAQLDSGSGKWEASLLWRKNRMHHFHLYGMAQWRSQSLAAETDLSTNNEGGLLHDQWLFIDNASTACFVIVMRKMVSVLHKSHQKMFNFYSWETWPKANKIKNKGLSTNLILNNCFVFTRAPAPFSQCIMSPCKVQSKKWTNPACMLK